MIAAVARYSADDLAPLSPDMRVVRPTTPWFAERRRVIVVR